MSNLNDFEVGQRLWLRWNSKATGWHDRPVRVTAVNWQGNGRVTWQNERDFSQGSFDPETVGTRGPFGLQEVLGACVECHNPTDVTANFCEEC